MSDELQDELGIGRPRNGSSGGRLGPGLEIGQIGGEGAQGVGAHPGVSQMLEGGDISLGEDLGIAIGGCHWQDSRQGIEFLGSPDVRCRPCHLSLPHVVNRLLIGLWRLRRRWEPACNACPIGRPRHWLPLQSSSSGLGLRLIEPAPHSSMVNEMM